MKKLWSLILLGTLLTAMMLPSFAGTSDRPVDVYAELAGKTAVEAWEEMREENLSFGELAQKNGFGDAFQAQIKEVHEARISEMVEAGFMTEEEAAVVREQIGDCEGTPGSHRGTHGFGYGAGNGLQDGQGRGRGGRGNGFGHRFSNDD